MDWLNTLAREYVAVVGHCMTQELGESVCRGTKYAVPLPLIMELLKKNLYEKPTVKLAHWKQLRWIDGEGRHIARRVYLQDGKARQRRVCVDITAYEALCALQEKINEKVAKP